MFLGTFRRENNQLFTKAKPYSLLSTQIKKSHAALGLDRKERKKCSGGTFSDYSLVAGLSKSWDLGLPRPGLT